MREAGVSSKNHGRCRRGGSQLAASSVLPSLPYSQMVAVFNIRAVVQAFARKSMRSYFWRSLREGRGLELAWPGQNSMHADRVGFHSSSARTASHRAGIRPLEVQTIVTEEPESALKKALAGKADFDPSQNVFLPPGADLADERALRRLPGSNIYLGPGANDAPIKQAELLSSSVKVAECPKDGLPEFALVGRSNVGKSSLLNALVRRKELAGTSKAPGKTQVINHYLINKSWYLVDLPGYGYAKAPTETKTIWNAFTKDYFLRSNTLVCVLLLIDASIPPQQIDIECADWLGRNKIPVTVVFTKCDKKKKRKNNEKPEENVKEFERLLKKSYKEVPPWIVTSSVTNQGRDELLIHIAQLRNYWSS